MNIIIANSANYFDQASVEAKLGGCYNIDFVTQKSELTFENVQQYDPDYIFCLHWSYIIPESVFNHYQVVIFHMTDLPYGRGGSPLQNLIAKGYKETTLTALLCTKDVDAGPVFLKERLSLHGTAQEIYLRAQNMSLEMINQIVDRNSQPQEQEGTPTYFQRRKPEDGKINNLVSLEKIFDYIRMLDCDGYPPAYIELGGYIVEFTRASYKGNEVIADARIRLRDE